MCKTPVRAELYLAWCPRGPAHSGRGWGGGWWRWSLPPGAPTLQQTDSIADFHMELSKQRLWEILFISRTVFFFLFRTSWTCSLIRNDLHSWRRSITSLHFFFIPKFTLRHPFFFLIIFFTFFPPSQGEIKKWKLLASHGNFNLVSVWQNHIKHKFVLFTYNFVFVSFWGEKS